MQWKRLSLWVLGFATWVVPFSSFSDAVVPRQVSPKTSFGSPVTAPYVLPTKEQSQFMSLLPLSSAQWTTLTAVNLSPPLPIPFSGGQTHLVYGDGLYCIFIEQWRGNNWAISMLWAPSLTGPWTLVENILTSSGVVGDANRYGVADPCVLYIEHASPKWHMWMEGFEVAFSSGRQCILRASASDPRGPWTFYTGADGRPKRVLEPGTGSSDYDKDFLHCPEVFLWGGVVHMLYGCQGKGHTLFDTMLAIASDNLGLGYSFQKWGPVTIDETLTSPSASRLQGVLVYGNVLYSVLGDTNRGNRTCYGPFVCSWDGGRTWGEFGPTENRSIISCRIHSMIYDNGKIVAAGFPAGGIGGFGVGGGWLPIYTLDLGRDLSPMGTTITTASAIRIPLTHNTHLDYRIRGTPFAGAGVGFGTGSGVELRAVNAVLSNTTGTALLRPSWNNSLRVGSGLVVDGDTTVSGLNTTGTGLYVNRDGPNSDSGIYFYSGGSPTDSSIVWNNSLNRFVVNKVVNIANDLYLSTVAYSGSGYYDFGNGLYLGVSAGRPVYFRNSTGPTNFTSATAQGLWQMARVSTKILAHATGTTSHVVVGGASDYLSTGTTAMDWSLPPIRTQWNSQTTGTITSEYTFFNGTNQTCSIEPYRHTGSVYDSTFWLAGVTYRELTLAAGAVVTLRAAPSPRHVWLVKTTQGTVGGR